MEQDAQRADALTTSPFDEIRRFDARGREFWSARDLMAPLGYAKWQTFAQAIERARLSAENSRRPEAAEFVQVTQLTDGGNLGQIPKVDYHLSRAACYLVAMNGDPRKPEIAHAQAYFVGRTLQAEASDLMGPAMARPVADVRTESGGGPGQVRVDGQTYYTVEGYYASCPDQQVFSVEAMRGMLSFVCWGLEGRGLMSRGVPAQEGESRMYPVGVFEAAYRVLVQLRGVPASSPASIPTSNHDSSTTDGYSV